MFVGGCFIFSSKITRNRLSAGLRPDPLGELTALPQTHSWIKGPTYLTPRLKRGTPYGNDLDLYVGRYVTATSARRRMDVRSS